MSAPLELKRLTPLEARFVALTLFISLFSLQALAWLCAAAFTPLNVGAGAVVCLLITLRLWRRFFPGLPRLVRGEWLLVGITVLGFLLRCNPSSYLYGGQDPGVYANVAGYFARHGTTILRDPLLDELKDAPALREYYVSKSIRTAVQQADGHWVGNMLPGIYLQDLDKNEFISQFYYVSPMLLAVGQWLFGVEWQGFVIVFLSALTVLAAGLIAFRVTRSYPAAALAAALLATNSTHSYMATFPVSEGAAGFFFLTGVFYLVARLHYLSVAPFFALFLTRITGFITLPLLLVSLAWSVIKRGERKAVRAGLAYIAVYTASYYWGLTYSPGYSKDIYRGKFGISLGVLNDFWMLALGLAIAWVVVCQVVLRWQTFRHVLSKLLMRYGVALAIVVLTALVSMAVWKGYLLGFTDHYVGHRWFDKRWGAVKLGFKSMRMLSVHTLAVMLSYVGTAAFLFGLSKVGRIGLHRAAVAPVALLAAGFLAVFSIQPLITPYLYYFGRYLVSELLPLAIICGAIGVHFVALRFPKRGHLVYPIYLAVVFASLLPSFIARLSLREGREFHDAISCIDQFTRGKSVIFVDKRQFAETPIVTPLRFTFDKTVFSIRASDFTEPGKLESLFDYFTKKGYSVYLLSSQTMWGDQKKLQRLGRYPMIMRTIGGKGSQPVRIRTRNYPVRLYALDNKNPVPPLCKRVEGYGE